MAHPGFSSRIGLFTLLLGVIAVSLFGSLVAADRALVRAAHELAELDARRSALVVGRDLRLRAELLRELFDPLIGGSAAQTAEVRPPAGFEAVWVLDSLHRVVWPRAGSEDPRPLLVLARMTTPTRWPAVQTLPESDALLLAVPLTHRGAHLGTAIGRMPASRLLDAVRGGAAERRWMALEASGRPVTAVMSAGARRPVNQEGLSRAEIPVAGEPLQLVVARADSGQGLRRVLWFLGVVALAALLAGLVRQRRQTASLATRTAELERLYQEVARSNRMKSEFLANVSHELRTPLNAIVGFVEMLREGVYGDLSPRQALPVDRIAASATHLRQLVDRLLDIAKIAAGRVEVHVEPVMLRAFVLNVASEMESLVSERGLALSISVPPALPRIQTDQTHLRQILINLIGNAVKYTPEGTISVRAVRVGAAPAEQSAPPEAGSPPAGGREWVALMVTDTGVGIDSADQERIFDEFEQVNAGARTDSARRGTGLGLAISRRLARLLGGDIAVVSNRGGGSTFTVWLPVQADAEPAELSPEPRVRTPA